ncbi:vitamin K epoxide reductase family protein [Streptomyces hoynatensis]|uniref:Vitamin K epoxide reductase family protein n=1 Tax=Streptomyces hoynatensis TaxID=1141874 RepID=A0A3A9ZA06_9ACTN|nr:vitamin K epoxide reductase family protein [Streptomyces hoynatensis]RKN44694.1 vitamin K epoxide reductase family protein [Streptomyces hoynatensis]
MATSAVDEDRRSGEAQRRGQRDVGAGRGYALLLVITGFAGLLASWVITLDKFHLLEDPDFTPACSLNPVVSCGSVMKSDQASAFGFPNPMLGLATYGVVVAIGMGVLAGARFRRWFWLGLEFGTLFGVGFCTWLQYQSLYEINALCLWCCLAWVATILMFWYTTLHNVRQGHLPAPSGVKELMGEFHWLLPAVHIGIIGMMVLTRWWDFWTG